MVRLKQRFAPNSPGFFDFHAIRADFVRIVRFTRTDVAGRSGADPAATFCQHFAGRVLSNARRRIAVFRFNQSPLQDISTDRLRSNLRQVLEEVRFGDTRFCVLRRGRPVAGLVPITEARALLTATRADRRFTHVHLQQRIASEDRLRMALSGASEDDIVGYGAL